MKFKEELHNIELPPSLSKRGKRGIELAAKEKQKKSLALLPAITAVVVTAAMILFIFNFKNWLPTDSVTANGEEFSIGLHPAYITAIAITCCSVMLCIFIFITKKARLPWLIIIILPILSVAWNLAEKQAHLLLYPKIMPLHALDSSNFIPITYYTNKEDAREIEKILINGSEYNVHGLGLQDPNHQNQFTYQTQKVTTLQYDYNELLSLKNLEMTAVLSDGSKYEVPTFPIEQQKKANQFLWYYSGSSGSNGIVNMSFKMKDEFHINKIILPKVFPHNMELSIHVINFNGVAQQVADITEHSVVNNQGKMIYKNIPTTTEVKLDVTLAKEDTIHIKMRPINNNYYHLLPENIMYLANNSNAIPIVNLDFNYAQNYNALMETMINQQRGEARE